MRLLKSFIRRRGFFSFAIATLTTSVGAILAVFTIVNALWLRPSPLPDPDRLVMVLSDASHSGCGDSLDLVNAGSLIFSPLTFYKSMFTMASLVECQGECRGQGQCGPASRNA